MSFISQYDVSFISNTLFNSLTNKAINLVNSISFLNIIECIFLFISSSGDGGAIYFFNELNGKSYQSKNCYYFISSSGWGSAFSILTNMNNINNYYYISYSLCNPSTSIGGVSGIEPFNGIQEISSINGSNCYTWAYGCIGVRSSKLGITKFSNFINCYSTGYIILCYHRSNNHNISNINVVNNSQVANSWGIFSNHAKSNTFLSKSILINNMKIGYKYLFCSDGGIFEIKDCWIQNDILYSNVNIINSFSITNTFKLIFFSTSLCKGNTFIYSNDNLLKFFSFFQLIIFFLIV